MSGRTSLLIALAGALCVLGLLFWPKDAIAPIEPAEVRLVEPKPSPRGAPDLPPVAPSAMEQAEPQIARALGSDAIAGIVENELGDPIASAAVAAYDPDSGAARAESDVHGRFAITRLNAAKHYRVSAVAAGYGEFAVEQVAAGTHDVRLVLPPASMVRGRVIDASTSEPLPRFDVAYLPASPESDAAWAEQAMDPNIAWQSIRDPAGSFAFDNVRANQAFAIVARAEGYASAFEPVAAIAPGESVEIEIRLGVGAAIAGVVVTPDGAPASSARILAGPTDRTLVEAATADAEGRFRIESAPTLPLKLVCYYPGYDVARGEVTPVPGTTVEIRLTLAEGGVIAGTVAAGGAIAPGQQVVASRQFGPGERTKSGIATTDSEGRYEIRGLPSGQYDVIANVKDESDPDNILELSQVAVVEAGSTTIVDFSFEASTAAVAGRITVDGVPPIEADVTGVIGAGESRKVFGAHVNSDGTFRAERLPAGAAYMEVTARIGNESTVKRVVTFSIGEGQEVWHEIAITTETAVTGVVEGLEPGEIAEVFAVSTENAPRAESVEQLMALRERAMGTVSINDDGSFRIEGLEAGDYTIIAITMNPDDDAGNPIDSLRLAHETVTVVAGEEHEINLAP